MWKIIFIIGTLFTFTHAYEIFDTDTIEIGTNNYEIGRIDDDTLYSIINGEETEHIGYDREIIQELMDDCASNGGGIVNLHP